jgi:recombination protein RecT
VVKTAGGDYLTHSMPLSKVYDIRDRSEAWKAYKKDSSKTCPWVTDEEEMIKKTCVKQASKYWPKRERLDQAIHHMNTDGGEGITLKPNTMPEDEYLDWKAKIEKANDQGAAKARLARRRSDLRGASAMRKTPRS